VAVLPRGSLSITPAIRAHPSDYRMPVIRTRIPVEISRMVAGTSHRFQRWAPVFFVTETVPSGIYERAAVQPRQTA
jgi:hypothetical protein